ncbi:MAG: phosphopantothenoylcysteine decarboxylase [Verrucomicrobiota bacterium]
MTNPDEPTVPLAIVTCGPGVSPIDAVRRISNFSTGELGVRLTECLLEHGWNVVCFKSTAATHPSPTGARLSLELFTTNAELEQKLQALPQPEAVRVVFHAAALSDYEVNQVLSLDGELLESPKFSSRLPGLNVVLTPARKVLPELRTIFPEARVVGWKFELEGDTASAVQRGAAQLRENDSALCVVNGAAFGEGFGILTPQGALTRVPTRSELCMWLTRWATSLVAP